MQHPLVSIIIATHNSGKILERVLRSIKKQDYPKSKIEILIIDGTSTDNTVCIAKKYKCKIFENPKIDQVYGKYIGYLKAKGEYAMLIDSDEILVNKKSIRNKIESFNLNRGIKVVVSSGYKIPRNYHPINHYLSELGDPFTYFMYRDSKDPKLFLNNLKSKYKKILENKKLVVFDLSKSKNLPFIELTSMATIIDLKYIRKMFPAIFKNPATHTHLFYLLNSKNKLFAVMKNDKVLHYSVATLSTYLKKIKSRVRSNIYGTEMGMAGFIGRERYDYKNTQLRKFMFVPYTLSVILPIIDSIYLSISRNKLIYLLHFGLCLYTLLLIVFYYVLRLLGVKIVLVGYGR